MWKMPFNEGLAMCKVIYTKSCDNADEMKVEEHSFDMLDKAISYFNDTVKSIVDVALNNEFLDVKMSMHKHKALIKIESEHHCVALIY